MKKIAILFCIMFLVLGVVLTPVYADVTVSFPDGAGGNAANLERSLQRTWATVIVVVQIVSVGMVVFAGLRYMFASADKKADIKRRFDLVGYRRSYCIWRGNNNKIC